MGQTASKAAQTISNASKQIKGAADARKKSFEYNPTRGQGPDAPKLPEKMQEMPEVSFCADEAWYFDGWIGVVSFGPMLRLVHSTIVLRVAFADLA